MLIEQAIFTLGNTTPDDGYRLVASSPGLTAADGRELAAWGPGAEAVCGGSNGPTSVNFHPLSSGASCVGYSTAVKDDYKGRNGRRAYTQCLVVPPEVMARFANNPFALLRAARANGSLEPLEPAPKWLEPMQLSGNAQSVDEGVLGEIVDRWGPRHLAWLVQTALSTDALVIVGSENSDWLIAGLLNCLPVECRPELSAATGLSYSQRRPYRLNAVIADAAECRRIGRQMGVTLIDLNDRPPSDFEPTGWAKYVEAAAKADRLTEFAAELGRPRLRLRISDLSWLAIQFDRAACKSIVPQTENRSRARLTKQANHRSFNYAPAPIADFSYPGPRPSDSRPANARLGELAGEPRS